MTTPLNLTARAKDAALTGFTLTQAIGEAIGYASTCWVDRDGDRVFDSQAATLLIRDLQAAIAVLLRISINQQNLDSDLDLADWQAVEILLQAPAMGYESEMHSPTDLDHPDGSE